MNHWSCVAVVGWNVLSVRLARAPKKTRNLVGKAWITGVHRELPH